jgi:hypothetical protein
VIILRPTTPCPDARDGPVLRGGEGETSSVMRPPGLPAVLTDGMTDEVAIVGAGPTGLLLAGDLAAAGVPCTVLERRAGESNLTQAFSVHARTLELLDARGPADELLATATTVDRLRVLGGAVLNLAWLPAACHSCSLPARSRELCACSCRRPRDASLAIALR